MELSFAVVFTVFSLMASVLSLIEFMATTNSNFSGNSVDYLNHPHKLALVSELEEPIIGTTMLLFAGARPFNRSSTVLSELQVI